MLIIRLRFKIFRIENYFRNLQSSLKTKWDVSHGIDTVQQDQVVDERSFGFQNKPSNNKILIESTNYKYWKCRSLPNHSCIDCKNDWSLNITCDDDCLGFTFFVNDDSFCYLNPVMLIIKTKVDKSSCHDNSTSTTHFMRFREVSPSSTYSSLIKREKYTLVIVKDNNRIRHNLEIFF